MFVCLCCSVRLLLVLFVDNLSVQPAKKTHNVKRNKGLFFKNTVFVFISRHSGLFSFIMSVFSHMSGCWIVFLNGHNGSAYFWLLGIQRCSSDLSCVQASAAPSHTGETGPSSWGLLAGRDLVWCHIIRWDGLIYWTRESLRYSNGFQHKMGNLRPNHTWFLLTADRSEHQQWKLINEGFFMAATSCLLYFMAANSLVGVCGQLLPPAQFHYIQ